MKKGFLYRFVDRIELLISRYIGLSEEKVLPLTIEMVNGHVNVINRLSYKRYIVSEPWDEFRKNELNKINEKAKKRLGLAMGKAIAKNLVISFDEVCVRNLD